MSLSILNESQSHQIAQQHNLKVGDLLKISRLGHNHYAVYVGVVLAEDNLSECFGGDPMVVHVSSADPSGGDINPGILLGQDGNRKIRPRYARLHELIGTNKWSVDTSWDPKITRFKPKEVKIRAEQAVDEVEKYLFDLAQAHSDAEQNCEQIQLKGNEGLAPGRYNFYVSNCEHFARWCVYGFGDSSQSRIGLSIAFGSFAGIITAILRRETIKVAIENGVTLAALGSAVIPPLGIGLGVGGISYFLMGKYAENQRAKAAEKKLSERRAIYEDWANKTPEGTSAAMGKDICGKIAITVLMLNDPLVDNIDPMEMVDMATSITEMMPFMSISEAGESSKSE